jgi:hypothetical protein
MNNIKRINISITSLVILLFIGLMAGAFRLSFDALSKEAVSKGIAPNLAWIFPIIVDMLIFGGSMFVIWATINKRKGLVWVGYAVIVATTFLSATLNRYHAPSDELLTIVYHVVPPVMLAVMTFLLERMIEVVMENIEADNKLQTTLRKLQGTCKQHEDTIHELQTKLQVEYGQRQQLESDYNKVAELVLVSKFINPDVLTFAKAKANLITFEEAFNQQHTYQRRNHAADFFNRVTIEHNAVMAD